MHLEFPSVSPFLELVQHERQIPNKIILRDHASDRTATAGQLLQSVSLIREKLQGILHQQNGTNGTNGTNGMNGANGMSNGESTNHDKFIYLIAPPGLEYVVSMLTIFSLGEAMSAQCK